MKLLSAEVVPLPKLAVQAPMLCPKLLADLDRRMVAHPSPRIGETFWGVVEVLHEMLLALKFDELEEQELSRRKRSILDRMELLMHRCATLNDYLGTLMQCSLPTQGKKNRNADAAKRRLDAHINRLYKIPINFVKHDGFGLSWIEMSQGKLQTHGYMVTGPIGNGMHGPIKFRRIGRDDPEGYSFALSLREVLPALYQMCDITQGALLDAGLFIEREASLPARDVRGDLVSKTLELLNQLPLHGFPDEYQARVPIFHLRNGSVGMTTSPLRKIPGTFRINSELRSVRKGGTYKIPYWQNNDFL